MIKLIKKIVPGAAILFIFMNYSYSETDTADMILLNGKVITIDRFLSIKQAVAIKKNRLLKVGSTREILKYKGRRTKVYDMEGKTIVPGLHDAHLHFESGVKKLSEQLSLKFMNLAEIQEKIKETVEASPPGAVIRAYNFNQVYFKNKQWPSKIDLDKIAPDNPVIITRVDGHSLWLNSAALQMSGIVRETKDPQGGEIQRDKAGNLTGILKETAAGLVKNILGPKMVIPGSSLKDPVEMGIEYANKLGLTSVTSSGNLKFIARLNQLRAEGKLSLRFNVWLPAAKIDHYIAKGITLNHGDDFVKTSFLKIYADGTIGSATAAMFKPYIHQPGSKGIMIQPGAELTALIKKAHLNNWQIGVHAIGNRAVKLVLDGIEAAQKFYGKKNLRHRIEHSQFIRDKDLKRYHFLEVLPSMQPTHCTSDLLVVEDRIGKKRARQGYRWYSFKELKVMIPFGTDWPVEPLDPRRGLYSAIERKNIENGLPENGWFPEEEITLTDAIRYYTLGSAFGVFNENKLGSIEEGKLADLTVFDGDLLKAEEDSKRKILSIPVFMTIVNGKIVYSREQGL